MAKLNKEQITAIGIHYVYFSFGIDVSLLIPENVTSPYQFAAKEPDLLKWSKLYLTNGAISS